MQKMMQHDNVRPTLACRLMMGIIIMRVEDEGYLNIIRCENFTKHVAIDEEFHVLDFILYFKDF